MGKIIEVPISMIRASAVALRQVDTAGEQYLGVLESIRRGSKGAISVRPKVEEKTGVKYYEIIDGLHRWTANTALGNEKMWIDVCDESDEQVLCSQIMMNTHHVDQKPQEVSKQLQRILDINPTYTEAQLAKELGYSIQWIQDRLALKGITDKEIQKMVDDGKICLANAVYLSRLPAIEQAAFVDRAMTEKADVFAGQAKARIAEINTAKKQGKDAAPVQFAPVAHFRKPSEVRDEAKVKAVANDLVVKLKLKTPQDGFLMALKWLDHMDPESIAQAKIEFDTREAAAKLAKEAKEEARTAAKAAKLEEAAAKTQAEAAAARAAAEAAAKSRKPGVASVAGAPAAGAPVAATAAKPAVV